MRHGTELLRCYQRTPYTMDLFDDSTDKTPVNQKHYMKIVGCLIHLLMVRSEIQLAVIMAATHNSNPTTQAHPHPRPHLPYCRWRHPPRPVRRSLRRSPQDQWESFSVSFSIGQNSSPFHTISLSPSHGKFHAYSLCVEYIKYYRHFMDWIGFPQESFTEIRTDCAPAIRMATAPFFPRNSKNALIQDRNVREAMDDDIMDFVHVLSKDFDADLNAKPSLDPLS